MPIIDYDKASEKAWNNILNSPEITTINKKYLKEFDKMYKTEVRPSRRAIFYKHIIFLLKHSKDIKQEMNEYKIINDIFSKINDRGISDSYKATIINVSLRFVRWLNDGERPIGFKDIKNISKKKQMRSLNPDDMLTWEEAELICSKTTSPQYKAILMTQLDFGLRPSEFIDLKYKDVKFEKHISIINAPCTKVEENSYPVPWGVRCTPYLQKWIRAHPTKKPNDPLWILENINKSNTHRNSNKKIIPMQYEGMRKLVSRMAHKVKITKKIDFYLLRHSSCVLDKMDNLPIDLAADRHRHSVAYFKSTYGRLSLNDVLKRVNSFFGYDVKKKKQEQNTVCVTCNCVNKPFEEYCTDCGTPLTPEAATKYAKEQRERSDQKIEDLKLNVIKSVMQELKNRTEGNKK